MNESDAKPTQFMKAVDGNDLLLKVEDVPLLWFIANPKWVCRIVWSQHSLEKN